MRKMEPSSSDVLSDYSHVDLLDSRRDELVSTINIKDLLLDRMISKGILDTQTKERIQVRTLRIIGILFKQFSFL